MLLTSSTWGFEAVSAAATNSHGGALWEDALGQVQRGWLDGPFPSDDEGRLITGQGPQPVNLTFRLGVQQGGKLRAVDDLKRSQADRTAKVRTPVNLPACGNLAAIIRMVCGEDSPKCVVIVKADHKGA